MSGRRASNLRRRDVNRVLHHSATPAFSRHSVPPVQPYSWSLHAEAVVLVPLLALGYAWVARRYPPEGWRIACFLSGLALILAVFRTPLQSPAPQHLIP